MNRSYIPFVWLRTHEISSEYVFNAKIKFSSKAHSKQRVSDLNPCSHAEHKWKISRVPLVDRCLFRVCLAMTYLAINNKITKSSVYYE